MKLVSTQEGIEVDDDEVEEEEVAQVAGFEREASVFLVVPNRLFATHPTFSCLPP